MDNFHHVPVLLDECIEALNIRPDGIYVDGTLGGAGHSSEIVKRLTTGALIGIDRDPKALEAAGERLRPWQDRVKLVHGNFSELEQILSQLGIPAVDGMLFDTWAYPRHQLDDAARGFSYMADAPLDMRMNPEDRLSAWEVVNQWPRAEPAPHPAGLWGGALCRSHCGSHRAQTRGKPIQTTLELVDLIRGAMPPSALREKQHPAKTQLSGHPHRRQRRARGGRAHDGHSHRPPQSRRTAGGDYLPLFGRPHRQIRHGGGSPGLHLPRRSFPSASADARQR